MKEVRYVKLHFLYFSNISHDNLENILLQVVQWRDEISGVSTNYQNTSRQRGYGEVSATG
jgi:hypothetical protein